MDLNFNLHPAQMKIFESEKRFVVAACGRRFGKTFLAAVRLIVEGLKDKNDFGYDLSNKAVYYVAPTFQQGKDIIWGLLKELGKEVIVSTHENTATLTLVNGRRICIKGADRPDSLRGVGVSFIVLDEFADMKPETWDLILRPALADVKGSALFIGTPKGKNHFFDLYAEAEKNSEDWEAFTFRSVDNPTIPIEEEVKAAEKEGVPMGVIRQEYEASFMASGLGEFKEEWLNFVDEEPMECREGRWVVTVDPAGYEEVKGQINSKLKRLDEMAITIANVHPKGWHIKEIRTGRWGIREASLQIVKAARDVQATSVGIEKGSLKNAVMPYLQDQMNRLGIYFVVDDLTHGGKKKTERIMWALQGRFQNGRVTLEKGSWNRKFTEQYLDFPNPMSHDDMLDSLAYVDQISNVAYNVDIDIEEYQPLDIVSGY